MIIKKRTVGALLAFIGIVSLNVYGGKSERELCIERCNAEFTDIEQREMCHAKCPVNGSSLKSYQVQVLVSEMNRGWQK